MRMNPSAWGRVRAPDPRPIHGDRELPKASVEPLRKEFVADGAEHFGRHG